MTSPRGWSTELGVGSGIVAATGGVAMFVARNEAAEAVVEVLRDITGSPAAPGRPIARRLAALVAADADDTVPDFGVFAALDDGFVVLVHGAVTVSVTTGAGKEAYSGTSSTTWTDRILPPGVHRVLIAPADLARPGPSPLRLEAGVVPGGWLRVELAAAAPKTATVVPFELFSLDPDGVEARPPLPVEGVDHPPSAEPAATDHVAMEAVATEAIATEAVVTPDEAPAVSGPEPDEPRASLGLLVFDDGSVFGLDEDYVLGREPEIDEAVIAGKARPIALDDPADTVSRVHAEVRVAAPEVQLIDRGSTNGTHLWDEAQGVWNRLPPGEPRVIRAGDHGAVGRRTFVYELLDAPQNVRPGPRSAPETVAVERPVGSLVGAGGVVYPLDRSYVIGRDPLVDDAVRDALASPIVLRDDEISRIHARVAVVDHTVFVSDAGTTAGTFVAAPGAPAWDPVGAEATELPPGWSLRVGAHVFTFRAEP